MSSTSYSAVRSTAEAVPRPQHSIASTASTAGTAPDDGQVVADDVKPAGRAAGLVGRLLFANRRCGYRNPPLCDAYGEAEIAEGPGPPVPGDVSLFQEPFKEANVEEPNCARVASAYHGNSSIHPSTHPPIHQSRGLHADDHFDLHPAVELAPFEPDAVTRRHPMPSSRSQPEEGEGSDASETSTLVMGEGVGDMAWQLHKCIDDEDGAGVCEWTLACEESGQEWL